ncbi:TetR/AcrR family transcriptional regulator [Clostridium estertheticum]|uniref:TetR/AcrR family transcriptional regulator C-terminal domain-containing protein n=1 Tax=Clostridium estertheticum TaxID=238834 RepID=UPI001C0C9261|nr:TetR/AcrR family transcriptional regulator C-terminal domain-containing protein [Clostridium estertheticum]MBU3198392.1 TetR/AcrR family transcriptional regulator [Clostridium estertheticum]WAG65075.1 TetR/AcrR family transcriptional regulator [Clostridium estertheticum]
MIFIDTKQIILNATIKLMKVDKPNKLTVQNILDEAHVSRSTFYSFFSDKYDVINYYFKSYADSISNENVENSCAYQFLYDNKDYFIKALAVEGQNSFEDFFYNYYYDDCSRMYLKNMNKESLSDDDRISLEFYCRGSLHIAKQWLTRGAKESPLKMRQLTHQLIPEKYWKLL